MNSSFGIKFDDFDFNFSSAVIKNGATTFSITTLSILDLFATLSVNDTQHNGERFRVLLI